MLLFSVVAYFGLFSTRLPLLNLTLFSKLYLFCVIHPTMQTWKSGHSKRLCQSSLVPLLWWCGAVIAASEETWWRLVGKHKIESLKKSLWMKSGIFLMFVCNVEEGFLKEEVEEGWTKVDTRESESYRLVTPFWASASSPICAPTPQKQSDKSRAYVQLMGEPDVTRFDYDDICEYAGEAMVEDWWSVVCSDLLRCILFKRILWIMSKVPCIDMLHEYPHAHRFFFF